MKQNLQLVGLLVFILALTFGVLFEQTRNYKEMSEWPIAHDRDG